MLKYKNMKSRQILFYESEQSKVCIKSMNTSEYILIVLIDTSYSEFND